MTCLFDVKKYLICANFFRESKESDVRQILILKIYMQKNAKQKIKGKGMIIYHIKGTKKKWKQKTKEII